LLVAVGLTTIMLWGILQLFTSATRFSSTVTTQAELCAATRGFLERLLRELRSAAPLSTGYIRLVNGEAGAQDSIQFVCPIYKTRTVGEGDNQKKELVLTLGHVRFDVDDDGNLRRSAKVADDTNPPSESSTDCGTGDVAIFGLKVDELNIGYLRSGSESENFASKTFLSTADPDDETQSSILPLAIVIEIRVSDPKGRATISMKTSASLVAGGI
jgi:hypothetical protein